MNPRSDRFDITILVALVAIVFLVVALKFCGPLLAIGVPVANVHRS